ncbi:hypothetical protein B0H12DRAFT_1082684 [Mycena haematopus]|nr:hypothetical protein B0H12DRAFT_1082684 [Mycena haematopus]
MRQTEGLGEAIVIMGQKNLKAQDKLTLQRKSPANLFQIWPDYLGFRIGVKSLLATCERTAQYSNSLRATNRHHLNSRAKALNFRLQQKPESKQLLLELDYFFCHYCVGFKYEIIYALNFKRIPYRTVWVEYPEIEARCKEIGAAPTRTREQTWGKTLENLTPKGEEDVVQWKKLKDGFAKVDEWIRAKGLIVLTLWWIKLVLPDKWEGMTSWHQGRWAKLLKVLEDYETIV